MGDEHIEAVKEWPVSTNTKEVERFWGFANYHRGFLLDYTRIAAPLYQVTGKKPLVWETEQVEAFEGLS
jgi:hypothetical protein